MNESEKTNPFGNDYLQILGSGGGRYIAASQQRSTGGVLFSALNNSFKLHLDPGPGAIRDLRDWHIDPRSTNAIALTHAHTDHFMSLPIIIEALQDDYKFTKKKGIFIAPKEFVQSGMLDNYYKGLLHNIYPLSAGESKQLLPDLKVTATPTKHGKIENIGYIFEVGSPDYPNNYHYKIAFTSDTAQFPNYVETYKDVDILVANILRPNNVYCRGHLTIDEFIPLLNQIQPKLCVIIHLGGFMDNPKTLGGFIGQVEKLQKANPNTKVIGGQDGLIIPLDPRNWAAL